MSKNETRNYLLYAIGELILVVLGILIAFQIDEWGKEREEKKQQLKYYEDILIDLKKDSIHFEDRLEFLKGFMVTYYDIYDEIKGGYNKDSIPYYDFMCYNVLYSPVLQQNQQGVIDKLKSSKIRGLLNDHIRQQTGSFTAINEFNKVVLELARPYYLSNNAFNSETIFQENKFGFLPKGRLLNVGKVRELLQEDETLQILNYLRISSGYSVAQIGSLKDVNNELIEVLNQELNK